MARPPWFHSREVPLIEHGCWGMVMTLGFAVSIASIRRGPSGTYGLAVLALIISFFGVCGVVTELVGVLLR